MFSLEACYSLIALFVTGFLFNKVLQYFLREFSSVTQKESSIPVCEMFQSTKQSSIFVRKDQATESTPEPKSPTREHKPVKLRTLPVFGNLFDLGSHPHRNLFQLSSVHGDVIKLKLGKWKAVVLNGTEACREALIQNGRFTASRPDFESYHHYSHGKSLSFQPYNAIWQVQRKATSRTISRLLSSGLVSKLALRQTDKLISLWLSKVEESQGFDPAEDVAKTVGEFVYSFCYGEDELLDNNKEFSDILLRPNPGTDLLAAGNNIDFLPWFLRFISSRKQKNHIHRMDEFVRLNNLMREKVEEKLQDQMSSSDLNDYDDSFYSKNFKSVMEGMIFEVKKLFRDGTDAVEIEDQNSFDRSTLHKDCLLNLPSEFLSAGSETSTAALLWVIRFVATHPDVQENLFLELHEYVANKKESNDEEVTIDQRDKIYLPYTEACFVESLRLMAVVPFGLPHFTTADIQLGGKFIPKNTLLLPNLWSAGHDPRSWEDSEVFRPERHLSQCPVKIDCRMNDGSLTGTGNGLSKQELFFPFGLGRRRCVGEPVGKLLTFVTFANLMLNFRIELVEGSREESPSKESILGKLFSLLSSSLFNFIHPSFIQDAQRDILESYGDVMKPRAYKIILNRR